MLFVPCPEYGIGNRWGTDDLESLSRYDGMRAIRIDALGAYVLGLAEHMPPETAATAQSIKVLPNHDVVALGELPLGDRMTLSAFAHAAPQPDPRQRSLDTGPGLTHHAPDMTCPSLLTEMGS